jgi:hypothetical protein
MQVDMRRMHSIVAFYRFSGNWYSHKESNGYVIGSRFVHPSASTNACPYRKNKQSTHTAPLPIELRSSLGGNREGRGVLAILRSGSGPR